ncbi:efflux RND transporter permease subunit, partial [Candidatus Latescibacterota bacterium]
WDLHELRTVQDWYVRYALMSAKGVSEVASVGGFEKEYQIDIDPDALRAHNVKIEEVIQAVKMSNLDVGARTIEVNKVEYMIRGLGFVKNITDIENSVIKVNENVPILVKHVAHVALGPALRRGALDKGGTEAVGGVVVVRFGENPLAAIKNVKDKIKEISPGLPKKTLPDGTVSHVAIVPFYDRTGLINETLGTLNTALTEEILVTIIVILIMVLHVKSSLLISGLLPLAVLMCFIAMKVFGIDANIVALSGIAIAIGTMVDMGIVVTENILKHLERAPPDEDRLEVVYRATSEVGGAVVTAVATTVVSFLPVFTMEAAEGKLFKPLAFTKTFAMLSSVIIALTIIPPFAYILFSSRMKSTFLRKAIYTFVVCGGLITAFTLKWWLGLIIVLIGIYHLIEHKLPPRIMKIITNSVLGISVISVAFILAEHWLPLGPEKGLIINFIFVVGIIGGLLSFFRLFQMGYGRILAWSLRHKLIVLSLPAILIITGCFVWLGFDTFTGWMPSKMQQLGPVSSIRHAFPGLGKEFMPPLDEGSFLYMPTTMPHASIGEVSDVLSKQDMSLSNIPEIDSVVGKMGRAETPLDPAPISMIETVINYKPEYILTSNGKRMTFRFDPDSTDLFRNEDGEPVPAPDGNTYTVQGRFIRDENNGLIPDKHGAPFRLWRKALDPALNPDRTVWHGIETPDDIWDEIVKAAEIPGTTSAPKLQPIAARIVMLQSGMRAPMGVKVKGPDLATIEWVGMEIERYLKEVPSIEPSAVIADRIVGKPYLEIDINREEISRYGIQLAHVQNVIETAIGGKRITTTVEGRERYPVRVRYMRELRDSIEDLERILVAAPDGSQIPIAQLADISYVRGPQVIKSEDTFLIGYVLFDKKPPFAEVDVVEMAQDYLDQKIASGEFQLPAGVSFTFAGTYENQVRSQKKLMIVLPLALLVIFLILYFKFKNIPTTLLVFSGIFIAWMGGFIMLWLYGQSWFLDFSVFGTNMRDLFQVHPINLSVAVWVGFLALFGIASDDGVIMTSYLEEVFKRKQPKNRQEIHAAAIEAGLRRVRPCLMTTATTILALIPVLTSTGRGSDILVPMAIPSFGGMLIEVIILIVVPVVYAMMKEFKLSFIDT